MAKSGEIDIPPVDRYAFGAKKFGFGRGAAGKAAERTIISDHAVAGDGGGEGAAAQGIVHGSIRLRSVQGAGQVPIGGYPAA